MSRLQHSPASRPKVVIVGAGFGGLAATKALVQSAVDITLIDRRNHHVFQPLLYQVATAALSPAQIAQPIRAIVKNQDNCTVALGDVTAIDTSGKQIHGLHGQIGYDYLIVATGATHTWFNHHEWAAYAPGLKSVDDALAIRHLVLQAFEQAELARDNDERKALLTFVLVGGGPTGVEMAGAIAELARHTLAGEFRHINPATATVILVEAGARILPTFPEALSTRARQDLEQLGVRVITGQPVNACNEHGATISSNFIPCRTILWCAGVKASPAAQWLNAGHDQAGRVLVNPDLSVPGHPEIFVIGDAARVVDAKGITVPGLCPAAKQQGEYVATVIENRTRGLPAPGAFIYKDYGTMATIGRGKAVAEIRGYRFTGLFAWVLWGGIHLMPLVGFRNRIVVALDWFWSYLTRARGVRLMTAGQRADTDI
jgi:NADH dehydrogenase